MSQVFDELSRLITLDFWLGAPLRIVLIVVFAATIRVLLSLVIKKITHSVARGTTARVVRDEHNAARTWRTDTVISNSRQAQRARTVGSVLSSVASIVVWTMAVLMIISELGFNIAPVIASAGIAGVALSFGAQSLVKDFLAGIFIVAEDQLGIGDFVDLGEASGTVESVGLRITDVRDANGTLWHVRNGEIIRVGNSSQGWARTNIDLPVPYDSDIEQVTELLLDAARQAIAAPDIAPHVLDDPQVLGVEAVSGESLTVRVSVKTAPSQQWAVARALRVALKQALDASGARIPLLNQSVIRREN
ncbi:mechanosensitive ion channel family protein [Rothia sp. LK2588]|uniref:mechanosensitive ion channel family protein n=1 Tax=Rothia sp. LK2588 TaxID=3114369 RepID=UPI0034CDE345